MVKRHRQTSTNRPAGDSNAGDSNADDSDAGFDDSAELVSKSAGKREAKALTDLAVAIASLPDAEFNSIELPDDLRAAMDDYRRFRAHGARKRQALYIGKLMRKIDTDALAQALERIQGEDNASRYRHAQTERWRDALLAESDALTRYLAAHPEADRQAVRQAVVAVAKAKDDDTRRNRSRKLYRLLYTFEEDGAA